MSITAFSAMTKNSSIFIRYSVPHDSRIKISMYDLTGQCIRVLDDKMQTKGNHLAYWDCRLMGAGLYLTRLESGGSGTSRKILLAR
jgi:hypothetical protein